MQGGFFGQQQTAQQPQQQQLGFGMQQQQQQPAIVLADQQGQLPGITDENDVPVPLPGTEAVCMIKFSPTQPETDCYQSFGAQMMACAQWCGTLTVWQLQQNAQMKPKVQIQQVATKQVQSPVLGICWQLDAPGLLIASADNNLYKWDLSQNQVVTIAQHTQPIKDVVSMINPQNKLGIVITGGWDAKVKFHIWSSPSQLQQIGESYVAMPVHYMSGVWPLLVTAHQERFIHVWNMQQVVQSNNFDPVDLLESPLKFATTSIQVFGDGKGFAVGSIEGRCSINNYDIANLKQSQSKDFCFKCHRHEDTTKKTAQVYAVNGFSFNKRYNTFVSYGSDGHFYTWNKDNKSKYKTSKKFPSPITAGDFNYDGTLLAYAVGYDWSMGAEGVSQRQYQNLLYVRTPDIYAEVYKPPANSSR